MKATDNLNLLYEAFGSDINSLIKDPDVIEIMLNPDGRIWVDRYSTENSTDTNHLLPKERAEIVIRILSSLRDETTTKESPLFAGELPLTGHRFQGMLPPVAVNPVFTIRKKPLKLYSLSDFVSQGSLTQDQKVYIEKAVKEKKNIIVVGGTGSGKTTFTNALLKEISKYNERVLILEDTKEIIHNIPNYTDIRTTDEVSMRDLLKGTLRMNPCRIIVGEVRGGEALDLLEAWNTGHPGGIATVHADSAEKSLSRLERLIARVVKNVSKEDIAESIDLIIFIKKTGQARKVEEIKAITLNNGEYSFNDVF